MLQNKTDEVKPDLKIAQANALQVNHRNAVNVTVDNEKSTYVKNAAIDYQVEKDGKILTKDKKEKLTLAPSSRMPFLIQMDNTEFSPGTYTVKMTVRSENKNGPAVQPSPLIKKKPRLTMFKMFHLKRTRQHLGSGQGLP